MDDPLSTKTPETAPTRVASVDALLLDMDGTLVDSGAAVQRSWDRLFHELGIDRTFDHELHGKPARTVLSIAAPDLRGDELERAQARIEALETSDVDEVVALPGAERLVSRLEELSTRQGRRAWTIVTSCTQGLFEARWRRTGLVTPDLMVTADQVLHGKPDPEPYLLAARRLGVAPERCLVLEDSVGGLLSARAAGCAAVAVTTTTGADLLRPHAAAVVESLAHLDLEARDGAIDVLVRESAAAR